MLMKTTADLRRNPLLGGHLNSVAEGGDDVHRSPPAKSRGTWMAGRKSRPQVDSHSLIHALKPSEVFRKTASRLAIFSLRFKYS